LTEFFNRVSFTPTKDAVVVLDQHCSGKRDKGIKRLKRTGFYHYAMGMTLVVLVCLASQTTVLAQKTATPATPESEPKHAPSKPADSKPVPERSFVLRVNPRPVLNISLKADKAKMSEVAQALSKHLKVPVFLGPERQNESISIEFSELMLEPALRLMSPTVYVDYEVDTGSMAPPKALGIYFYDTNQGEPPLTAVVRGSTQSLLVEGNTEDGEPETDGDKKKAEEEPLRVSYLNNNLTVKAKKQPLPLVLLKIGEELGIPVDIQDQNISIVDTEISKLPVEDVVRQLSPNIRLFIRADLTRAEKRALRMVLAEPAKATQQNP